MEGMFDNQMAPVKKQPSTNAAVPMSPNSIPAPSSFGAMPTYNWSQGHEDQRLAQKNVTNPNSLQVNNPDYWDMSGSSKIYKKPDGSFADNSRDEQPPNENVDFNMENWMNEVNRDWERSMAAEASRTAGFNAAEDRRLAQIQAEEDAAWNAATQGGSGGMRGGSAGGGTGGTAYGGPVFSYPEYNSPGEFQFGASLDLPDYEPPEYDDDRERAVREEYIQTNKGALSKAAQSAILGSANVNNPQARGQIIKAALEGFGDALGQTTLAGSKEGRRTAEREQATETGIYQAKFQIESQQAMAKYDKEMKEDIMNWELQMQQADRDYSEQLSNWNSMPNDYKAASMPGANVNRGTAGKPTRYI